VNDAARSDDAPRGSSATDADSAPRRRNPTWLVATIAGAFGLFYAYAVWNALGNLIQSVQFAGDNGFTLSALGWIIWLFATAFPIIAFAAAFTIGYRRPAHHFILVMATGLALTAVFWLNVVAYTELNSASLLA
jgi:hypothetical protein